MDTFKVGEKIYHGCTFHTVTSLERRAYRCDTGARFSRRTLRRIDPEIAWAHPGRRATPEEVAAERLAVARQALIRALLRAGPDDAEAMEAFTRQLTQKNPGTEPG